MAYEYLERLNPEQTEAVVHSGSPLLILAGAGSGKTRVITTKIAYLIQHENVLPWSILAVTFTKKAAAEMKERAVKLEERASESMIKTFHSFGAWFLRRYAEEAGISSNFTVYDDTDSAALILKAKPELTKKQATLAAHKISLAKDYCLLPTDDLTELDYEGDLNEIYAAYEARLKMTGNVDFGDLILKPVLVLKQNLEIRKQMQHRFKVIMVDEYQDSNVAQFRLLQALSGVEENSGTYVCVVGDDDQSIYKFRGAEVQNILQFPKLFPGTKVIRLERNYRSTGKILKAADAVVSNNTDRLGKTLVADRGEGAAPVLVFLDNQDKEAEFCAKIIDSAVRTQGASYSDFAILYRTNAQSLGFEKEFHRMKIPYTIFGSVGFFEREEIKDIVSYLSLLVNPRDELSFDRIVNKPSRGIGEKSKQKIIQIAHETSNTLIENFNLLETASSCASSLPKKAQDGIKDFCEIMQNLKTYIEDESKKYPENFEDDGSGIRLSVFIQKVREDSGIDSLYTEQDRIDGTAKIQNLNELENEASRYPLNIQGLLEFLDSASLERTLSENSEQTDDCAALITLHNTKGLEFNRVIITGLESGVFPRQDKSGLDLEEERRLFYVGITRAKDELYITSCAQRRLYGRTEPMMPSIFLKEAGNVFTVMGRIPRGFSLEENSDSSFEEFNEDPKAELLKKWCKGTRLYHDDYGYGQIIFSSSQTGEVVIQVQFENGERKTFLPEYQSKKLDIIKD